MTIREYLQHKGIETIQKTAAEYCSACPVCGGKDRFLFWPNRDRFYCRKCARSGDLIDLLRNDGLTFQEARELAGKVSQNKIFRVIPDAVLAKDAWHVSQAWQKRADVFVRSAADRLKTNETVLKWLEENRGISGNTACRFLLGWNDKARYYCPQEWGLPEQIKENGKQKRLWIPRGLVIPRYLHDGQLTGLSIRRPDADIQDKTDPRYVFVSGGAAAWSFCGDNKTVFIIVESDLDAILLWQEVGDIATPISTGGAMGKPDKATAEILLQAKKLLMSLDRDRGGERMAQSWLNVFKSAQLWPIPKTFGKDHTEAMLQGLSLKHWLLTGLNLF